MPEARLAAGLRITNLGETPVQAVLNIRGIPEAPLPAAENGYRLQRLFYDVNGNQLSIGDTGLRQNDLVIVVLEGQVLTARAHDAVVVSLLPAGLEPDGDKLDVNMRNAVVLRRQIGLTSGPGLGRIVHQAGRDDRLVAAVSFTDKQDRFRVAFQVRAVTPGTFVLPGASIEAADAPQQNARTAAGSLAIRPAAE